MTVAARPRSSLRFRGRSFLALVLAPEPPIEAWFDELDSLAKRSPGFFSSRPAILDLSTMPVTKDQLATLLADLIRREIRIMGLESVDAALLSPGMPPIISGGRQTGSLDLLDSAPRAPKVAPKAPVVPERGAAMKPAAPLPTEGGVTGSLLIDSPVRSGQSIIFPQGDITVIGSVASGAEVVAGGSVHIYGALRGRAIAGSVGNANARIFCQKLEAELIAIDGLYQTAEAMPKQFRGKAVKAWLNGDAIMMADLNG